MIEDLEQAKKELQENAILQAAMEIIEKDRLIAKLREDKKSLKKELKVARTECTKKIHALESEIGKLKGETLAPEEIAELEPESEPEPESEKKPKKPKTEKKKDKKEKKEEPESPPKDDLNTIKEIITENQKTASVAIYEIVVNDLAKNEGFSEEVAKALLDGFIDQGAIKKDPNGYLTFT